MVEGFEAHHLDRLEEVPCAACDVIDFRTTTPKFTPILRLPPFLELGSATIAMRPAVRQPLKFLVVHGFGMDKRGFVDIERFGTTTLAEYNARIAAWSRSVRLAHGSPLIIVFYNPLLSKLRRIML